MHCLFVPKVSLNLYGNFVQQQKSNSSYILSKFYSGFDFQKCFLIYSAASDNISLQMALYWNMVFVQ